MGFLGECTCTMQGISRMEPLVMEAISWAFKPVLESVHPQEPQILAWRDGIASTLTAAMVPVRQYIVKVQAYETWLAVDSAAYVEALQVITSLAHLVSC